jgi:hypothetical protein
MSLRSGRKAAINGDGLRVTKTVKLDKVLAKSLDVKTNVSSSFRVEHATNANKLFLKCRQSLLTYVDISPEERCDFHEAPFPERIPLNVRYRSLLFLKKVHENLMPKSPGVLGGAQLEEFRLATLQRAVTSVILSLNANDVILVPLNRRYRLWLLGPIFQGLDPNKRFLAGHSRVKVC